METKALPMINEVLDLEGKLYSETDEDSLISRSTNLYFSPKSFERWKKGRVYEWIGIKKFKKVCEYIGRKLGKDHGGKNNYFIWDKSEDGLRGFEKETRFNEGGHFVGTVIPAMCLTPGWVDGDPFSVYIGGVLTAINIYSILLQRYNRARIYNTLDALDRREKMLAISNNLS